MYDCKVLVSSGGSARGTPRLWFDCWLPKLTGPDIPPSSTEDHCQRRKTSNS